MQSWPRRAVHVRLARRTARAARPGRAARARPGRPANPARARRPPARRALTGGADLTRRASPFALHAAPLVPADPVEPPAPVVPVVPPIPPPPVVPPAPVRPTRLAETGGAELARGAVQVRLARGAAHTGRTRSSPSFPRSATTVVDPAPVDGAARPAECRRRRRRRRGSPRPTRTRNRSCRRYRWIPPIPPMPPPPVVPAARAGVRPLGPQKPAMQAPPARDSPGPACKPSEPLAAAGAGRARRCRQFPAPLRAGDPAVDAANVRAARAEPPAEGSTPTGRQQTAVYAVSRVGARLHRRARRSPRRGCRRRRRWAPAHRSSSRSSSRRSRAPRPPSCRPALRAQSSRRPCSRLPLSVQLCNVAPVRPPHALAVVAFAQVGAGGQVRRAASRRPRSPRRRRSRRPLRRGRSIRPTGSSRSPCSRSARRCSRSSSRRDTTAQALVASAQVLGTQLEDEPPPLDAPVPSPPAGRAPPVISRRSCRRPSRRALASAPVRLGPPPRAAHATRTRSRTSRRPPRS